MKILSITTDQELSELRKYALEAAGHEVTALITEKDALLAAQKPSQHEVILICHHVLSGTTRQMIRLLRQYHPDARIIYLVRLYGEWPEVEADRYVVADGPAALMRVISEARATA